MATRYDPKFQIYLTDQDGKDKKVTETHPKLTATTADFQTASVALNAAYDGFAIEEVTLQSETSVYMAS